MTAPQRRSYFQEVARREHMRRRWRFPRIPGLFLVRAAGDCPRRACDGEHCTATSCTCAPCACTTCQWQGAVARHSQTDLPPDPLREAAQLLLDL
jgi:hypothetical protein